MIIGADAPFSPGDFPLLEIETADVPLRSLP